jgi:hypothetical protein
LPADILRRLDAISRKNFQSYNHLLSELTRGREQDIDWWVSRPATRNNHISDVYAQCMQLALVRALTDEGHHLVVKVDTPEMAAALRSTVGNRLILIRTGIWRTRGRRLMNAILGISSSLFHCLAAAAAAGLTRQLARAMPTGPLIVIDTFISDGTVANGQFTDRYYPGLMDALAISDRERCFYLPVFYRMRHYLKTFRALRTGLQNFLFYEDYAGLHDYAFAFGHWWRARKLCGAEARYVGFEIGPLIDADIRAGRFASIVVRALLAYRFHSNAKRRGVTIGHILDWYEGLDLNHAIAAGVNWHGRDTELTGFRSAGPLFYMSCTPAPHEVTCGVVPSTMAVVGTKLAEEIKTLCPNLSIIPGPGLRYRSLRALARNSRVPEGTVLVALPLSRDMAIAVIRVMAQTRALATRPLKHWRIKCHPALPQSEVLDGLGGALPEGMVFVEGDFQTWVTQADIVVGVGSSALMEAVALGVPTLCLAIGNHPTENPIPSWVDSDLSRVVYDAQEAAEAMTQMIAAAAQPDRDHLHTAMLGIADDLSTRRLLGLDPTGSKDDLVSPDGIEPSTL